MTALSILQCLCPFKSDGKCTGPFMEHKAFGLTQNLHCLICINTSAFVLSEASGTVLTPAIHGAGTIPTHLTSAGMIVREQSHLLFKMVP